MSGSRESSAGKSPSAFRTISEVATEIGVPQHVLRFWETRFFQLRPLKRAGGRRYYRPEDVAFLHRVRRLLYEEGYTIKGVQKLLRAGSKDTDTVDIAVVEPMEAEAPSPKAAPLSRGAAPAPLLDIPDPSDQAAATQAGPALPLGDDVPGRLSAEQKALLRTIRDELVALRDLLRHQRP